MAEIKPYEFVQFPLLLAHADVAKLVLKREGGVRSYKNAVRAVKTEDIPFINVYGALKDGLTPVQFSEWKAWGEELVAASDDKDFVRRIEFVIAKE